MRTIFATLFIVLWLQSLAVSGDPVFLTSYMSQRQLGDQSNSYMLYWTYNSTYIQFEVQFNQGSWGLFGIRDSVSSMSDAALFWLNNDTSGYFATIKLASNGSYSVNSKQNWFPLNAIKTNNNMYAFQFGRSIKLRCDNTSTTDIDIQSGNIVVVYSVGNNIDIYDFSVTVNNLRTASFSLLKSGGSFTCPPVRTVTTFDSIPTSNYDNNIDLMSGGLARIYWNYNATTFTGELHVRTYGWVSFGFSPNGDMAGSNVMVVWLDRGFANFSERYLYGGSTRGANRTANQSWTLLYYGQYNGYTIVKFQRPIVLCGPNQYTIPTGTPYSIFAFGTTPSAGGDIGYHGATNRGSIQAPFVSSERPEYNIPSDMETYDFSMSNILLPYSKTTYYCYPFRVPTSFTVKRHIYAYEVFLPEINTNSIHHILLYECPKDVYNESIRLEPGNCDQLIRNCPVVSLGWSVGGKTLEFFPSDTGYPIGGDSDYSFFLIELHYNNPEEALGYVSKMSMRYYMTKTLRPNELGMLTLGTTSDPYGMAIPPGVPDFTINTYCSGSCLNQKLTQLGQNITAVSSLLHTHLTGTSVSTKILRNGQMIGYLSNNPYYNFNFQFNLAINPRINITKNDALITTCTYNTVGRTKFTFGGIETTDEMCFNFITYYPRNKILRNCLSLPTYSSYVNLFSNLTSSGDMNVNSSSLNDVSTALAQAYSTIRITDNVKNAYKNFFEKTQTFEACDDTFNEGPNNPLTYSNSYTEANPCVYSPPSQNQTIIQKIKDFFTNFWNGIKKLFGS